MSHSIASGNVTKTPCMMVLILVELMKSAYIKELLWSFLCNLIRMTPDLGVVFLMFVLITGISLRALGGVELAQFLTRVWGCEGRSCVCCRHCSGLVWQEKSIWFTMLSVLAPRLNLAWREWLWTCKKRRRHRQSVSIGWTRCVAYIVHSFSGTLSHFHLTLCKNEAKVKSVIWV